MVSQFCYLMTVSPIMGFHLCTGLQVDDSVAEEVESLVSDVFSIMPILKHRACRELVPYLSEVVNELVIVLSRLEILRHLWH